MDIETIREYCLSKKGATESFPFDSSTLVFKVENKMFALMGLNREPKAINLKCDPIIAIRLREQYPDQILPGYHMSKKHWNTIEFDDFNSEELRVQIDQSYKLVVTKLTKKQQNALL